MFQLKQNPARRMEMLRTQETYTRVMKGGVTVLLCSEDHMHPKHRNVQQSCSGATCLKSDYHAAYFYADIVLLQTSQFVRILKCNALPQNSYLPHCDLPRFLKLLDDPCMTPDLFK
jgi:hypothetical protein